MAGRKPYKPTKKHIETVQKMKEKGATDKECYEALDISKNTWIRHKKALFELPIKKGNEQRQQNHLELARDALALRLQQRTVKETTTTTRTMAGVKQVETKDVEKVIQPSDTLIMFTLVNKSNGEWQSINKVEQNTEINNAPTLKVEWTD